MVTRSVYVRRRLSDSNRASLAFFPGFLASRPIARKNAFWVNCTAIPTGCSAAICETVSHTSRSYWHNSGPIASISNRSPLLRPLTEADRRAPVAAGNGSENSGPEDRVRAAAYGQRPQLQLDDVLVGASREEFSRRASRAGHLLHDVTDLV